MSNDAAKPHSAEYFGEQRDFWWNADFVELMARRWKLADVHYALDVGAGVGHWGRTIASHLAPEARVIGIDREAVWIDEAKKRAERAGLGERLSYRLGDATHIPFHDGVFDMVTCQTVLIHCADPRAVLREMLRVTKPGGLVAVAEPNNLANSMCLGSTQFNADEARVLEIFRLQFVCQRGKAKLGLGHNSIGELLPGWFAEVGLADISVYVSDKASSFIPPYRHHEERVRRSEAIEWAEQGRFAWNYEETRRYFLAGGGTEQELAHAWESAGMAARETAAALRSSTEHQAGGGVQYLIAGRKPMSL